MSDTPIDNRERLLGLLAERALGLSAGEDEVQFAGAAAIGLDPVEVEDEFARVAALVDLAFVPRTPAPMPTDVSARLGLCFLDDADAAPAAWTPTLAEAPAPPSSKPASGAPWSLVGISWLAVAACLVLAFIAWQPATEPTPAEQMRAWLAMPPADLVTEAWTPVAASDTITGEVQWSTAEQHGFMKITGLPVNDPLVIQYQLWIFDAERPEGRNAVDGGVFDAASDTIVVPIDAKLDVTEPTLFAVTTEPPGGVIKHVDDPANGYRIVITAPVASPDDE